MLQAQRWEGAEESGRERPRQAARAGEECAPSLHVWMRAVVGADTRRQVRETFHLPEEPCNDYVVHCLLCWCALAQEAREIKVRFCVRNLENPSHTVDGSELGALCWNWGLDCQLLYSCCT